MMPTAVAVVSDIIEVSRNLLAQSAGGATLRRRSLALSAGSGRRIRAPGELETRYYLRFDVADRPGVLAQLAGILGEHGISIHQMVQEGRGGDDKAAEPVMVVMTTHKASEAAMQRALAQINALPAVASPTRLLRIYE
jgi:homoserine dehydrogenase